jgi:hypothetical protein
VITVLVYYSKIDTHIIKSKEIFVHIDEMVSRYELTTWAKGHLFENPIEGWVEQYITVTEDDNEPVVLWDRTLEPEGLT